MAIRRTGGCPENLLKKLEKVPRRKIAHHHQVRADDTAIVVLVDYHTQRNLTNRFANNYRRIWTTIEK